MADEKEADGRPHIRRFLPGYFASGRAIKKLKHFRNLIIHDQRWGGYVNDAPPLEELLPNGTPKDRQHIELERAINKAIPGAFICLERAGAPAGVHWTDKRHEWDYDAKETRPRNKRMDAHLIVDYFRVKQNDQNGEMFRMTLGVIDQGIGYYEDLRSEILHRAYSPIRWIGFVLSIPVRTLIEAGLVSPFRDDDTTLLKWMLAGLQAAWAATLAWAAKIATDRHLLQRLWHYFYG